MGTFVYLGLPTTANTPCEKQLLFFFVFFAIVRKCLSFKRIRWIGVLNSFPLFSSDSRKPRCDAVKWIATTTYTSSRVLGSPKFEDLREKMKLNQVKLVNNGTDKRKCLSFYLISHEIYLNNQLIWITEYLCHSIKIIIFQAWKVLNDIVSIIMWLYFGMLIDGQ